MIAFNPEYGINYKEFSEKFPEAAPEPDSYYYLSKINLLTITTN